MARDVNDTKQNRKLEAIQKRYDQEDDAAMEALMAAPNGRQVVARLLRNADWMGEGWDANSARQTDFNAGRRNVGLDTARWAERVAPPEFQLMLQEASARDVKQNETKAAAIVEKEQTDG